MLTIDELESAYWAHIEAYGKNAPFIYKKVMYSRLVEPIKSKSGKSTVGWCVTYQGEDGTSCTGPKMHRKNSKAEYD
jgi:hypothetical protein